MLTQARLKELVSYDQATGVFTCIKARARAKVGSTVGSLHDEGYLTAWIEGRAYKCHRLAWLYVTGEFPAGEIDHIDGDRKNNTFANLRDVSKSGNMQNLKGAKRHNKLGLLGVHEKKGRFIAQIQVNKKGIHIGSFDTPDEAHEAYLKTKRELHDACTI